MQKIAFSIEVAGLQSTVEQIVRLDTSIDGVRESTKQARANMKALNKELASGVGQDRAAEIEKQYKELEETLVRNKETTLEFREAQKLLNKEVRDTARDFQKAEFPEDSIIGLEREYSKLRKTIRELSEDQRNGEFGQSIIKQSREIKDEIRTVSEAFGDTTPNIGNYRQAIEQALAGNGTLSTNLGSLATNFVKVAGPLALAAGGVKALANVTRDAINAAIAYDEQLAAIQKTTNLNRQEADQLSASLRLINTRTASEQLNELASAAGRLGITGSNNIAEFVEATDKTFVALGDSLSGSAEDIGLSLGKIADLFGETERLGQGDSILRIGSILNELGNNSKAQEQDILNFTRALAGVGSTAGISVNDVAALGATFAEFGVNTEVATTAISKLLPEIANDLERFAEVAGLSTEELGNLAADSPIDALIAIAEGAKSTEGGLIGLTEVLENFGIESARSAQVVTALANNTDRFREIQAVANSELAEGESITREFQTVNETLQAQIDKTAKSYENFLLSLDGGSGSLSNAVKLWNQFKQGIFDTATEINNEGLVTGLRRLLTVGGAGLAESNKIVLDAQNTVLGYVDSLDTAINIIDSQDVRKQFTDLFEASGFSASAAIEKWDEYAVSLLEAGEAADVAADAAKSASSAAGNGPTEDAGSGTGDAAARSINSLQENIKKLRDEFNKAPIGSEQFNSLSKEIERAEEELESITGKIKDLPNAGSIDALTQKISDLNQDITGTNDQNIIRDKLEEIAQTEAELAKVEEQVESIRLQVERLDLDGDGIADDIQKISKELEEALDTGNFDDEIFNPDTTAEFEDSAGFIDADKEIENLDKVIEKLEEFEKEVRDFRIDTAFTDELDDFTLDDLIEEIKELNAVIDNTDSDLASREGAFERLKTVEKAKTKFLSEEEKARNKEAKDLAKQREEVSQAIQDAAIDTAQIAADTIFEIERNRNQDRLDDRIEQINAESEAAIEAADGNAVLIEAIELEAERKRIEAEEQNARRQQSLAIRQAIVNGALAAVQALANTTLPFPASLTALIPIAATTAANIALIRSQSFADGGFTGPGLLPPDETGKRPAGIVHENELVLSEKFIRRHPDLAKILNQENTRLRKFAEGGFTSEQIRNDISRFAEGSAGESRNVNVTVSIDESSMREFGDKAAEVLGNKLPEAVADGIVTGSREADRLAERRETQLANSTF